MKIITQGEDKLASLHVVYDQHESTESKQKLPRKKSRKLSFKSKGCFEWGNTYDKSTICPPNIHSASTVARFGTMWKCVWGKGYKKLHEIVDSPEYEGQDIHYSDAGMAPFTMRKRTQLTSSQLPCFWEHSFLQSAHPWRYIAYCERLQRQNLCHSQCQQTPCHDAENRHRGWCLRNYHRRPSSYQNQVY